MEPPMAEGVVSSQEEPQETVTNTNGEGTEVSPGLPKNLETQYITASDYPSTDSLFWHPYPDLVDCGGLRGSKKQLTEYERRKMRKEKKIKGKSGFQGGEIPGNRGHEDIDKLLDFIEEPEKGSKNSRKGKKPVGKEVRKQQQNGSTTGGSTKKGKYNNEASDEEVREKNGAADNLPSTSMEHRQFQEEGQQRQTSEHKIMAPSMEFSNESSVLIVNGFEGSESSDIDDSDFQAVVSRKAKKYRQPRPTHGVATASSMNVHGGGHGQVLVATPVSKISSSAPKHDEHFIKETSVRHPEDDEGGNLEKTTGSTGSVGDDGIPTDDTNSEHDRSADFYQNGDAVSSQATVSNNGVDENIVSSTTGDLEPAESSQTQVNSDATADMKNEKQEAASTEDSSKLIARIDQLEMLHRDTVANFTAIIEALEKRVQSLENESYSNSRKKEEEEIQHTT